MLLPGLGSLRDRQSVTSLVSLLHDPDRMVQANTAVALARIGDRSVVPALIEIAEKPGTGNMFSMRFYAAFALGARLLPRWDPSCRVYKKRPRRFPYIPTRA